MAAEVLIYLAVLIGLTVLYVVVTTGLTWGLSRRITSQSTDSPTITVLIAAHNESRNIVTCLDALKKQTYVRDLIQVIVIDERSTDGTGDIAGRIVDDLNAWEVIRVEHVSLQCPKKNALKVGMARATGSIILTTDADCIPSPDWISSTVSVFGRGTGLVAGPAPLVDSGGKLARLLIFQSLLVDALTAGSIGIGFPLSCSGRNLAFRREAYEEAGGYDAIGHIVGGDDVLLMRRIHRYGWRIAYNHDPTSTVPSRAHRDRQWSRQIRYQSKARHYGASVLSVAIPIYILHVLLLVSPLLAWLTPQTIPILWSALSIKATADGVFLWRALSRHGQLKIMRWFPLVELLTIPYIAVFSALGTRRRTSWT